MLNIEILHLTSLKMGRILVDNTKDRKEREETNIYAHHFIFSKNIAFNNTVHVSLEFV